MPVRAVFRHFAALLVLLPAAIAAQPSQVVRIGGEDDPRESLLEPWDVQMISGRIVVLEKEAPFLKLFTLDNRFIVRQLGTLAARDRGAVASGVRDHLPLLSADVS